MTLPRSTCLRGFRLTACVHTLSMDGSRDVRSTVLPLLQAQVAPPSLLKPSQWFASQGRVVQIGIGGVAAFAGITLLIAIVRTVRENTADK